MNANDVPQAWDMIVGSRATWLAGTLFAYLVARRVHRACASNAVANPVAVSIVLLVATLLATGTSYETYFDGAGLLQVLLGPAVVALAVPLHRRLDELRSAWLPMVAAIVVGACIAAGSAIALASLFGASPQTVLSLAPKSITAPVAMSVADRIGGIPSLTASLVVMTGILGAVFGTRILDWIGVRDDCIRGVALGATSHGIGTARALQVSAEAGAFAGLAMALTAFVSSIMLPWLVPVFGLGV